VENATPLQLGERRQNGGPEPKRPTSGRPSPPTTRSGLPETNGSPCHPAMRKTSTSGV